MQSVGNMRLRKQFLLQLENVEWNHGAIQAISAVDNKVLFAEFEIL